MEEMGRDPSTWPKAKLRRLPPAQELQEEIALWSNEVETLRAQLEEQEAAQAVAVEAATAPLQEELKALKRRESDATEAWASVQAALEQLQADGREVDQAQIASLQAEEASLRGQMAALREAVSGREREVTKLRDVVSAREAACRALKAQIEALEVDRAPSDADKERIAVLERTVAERDEALAAAVAGGRDLERKLEEAQKVRDRSEEAENQLRLKQEAFTALEARCAKQADELHDSQQVQVSAQRRLTDELKRNEELEQELAYAREQLEAAQAAPTPVASPTWPDCQGCYYDPSHNEPRKVYNVIKILGSDAPWEKVEAILAVMGGA